MSEEDEEDDIFNCDSTGCCIAVELIAGVTFCAEAVSVAASVALIEFYFGFLEIDGFAQQGNWKAKGNNLFDSDYDLISEIASGFKDEVKEMEKNITPIKEKTTALSSEVSTLSNRYTAYGHRP